MVEDPMPQAKNRHTTIAYAPNVVLFTGARRAAPRVESPALPDPLADDAPKGRFVDQINAVAQQWAAAGAPWAVAARKPTTPKPQPRPAAGVPLDRTLERARTIIELAEAWGVDLRLAMAMGKGTAASPTARPAASIPPDAPSVLPFRSAAITEARP
jgi:hypothetical protein